MTNVKSNLGETHMTTATQTSLASLTLTSLVMPGYATEMTLWNLGSNNIYFGGSDIKASAPLMGIVILPSTTEPITRKANPFTKSYIICKGASTYKVIYE